MNVIDTGSGLPMVLLHAFPVDSRMWDGVRSDLAANVRVITPDQRGLGWTPLPRDGRPPSLNDVAADVIAMLDQLGLERVVLGGCSMGGYVAMAILRFARRRVAGLILSDTKVGADSVEQVVNRLSVAERAETEGSKGWLAENMVPNLLGDTSLAERPGAVNVLHALIEEQPAAGVSWAQRAMAVRRDATEVLRNTAIPALVMVGEQDKITPIAEAERLTDTLPYGELTVLPRVGHLPAFEDPRTFTDTVMRWLSRFARKG
ncbi:MAG: alpha/beta fold hydrolase [Pseudonocardiaceae bacterium]|nr:alpha/beta fold hydrolase [Pseudonocardiaceae bacterium]